jgi:hypothetical protein
VATAKTRSSAFAYLDLFPCVIPESLDRFGDEGNLPGVSDQRSGREDETRPKMDGYARIIYFVLLSVISFFRFDSGDLPFI